MMKPWATYDWQDLTPDPIEPVPGHVAQIAYSPEFREAMGFLRAAERTGEVSERVLALTAAVIAMNPAHYSVWDYRIDLVKQLGNKVFDYKQVGLTPRAPNPPVIGEDGDWLNQFTLSHAKNYQVWNYRQQLLDPDNVLWYRGERVLARLVFDDDAKNFHAWSHLKWVVAESLVRGTDAFGSGEELLKDADDMLKVDVYNNSVWSFRHFVLAKYQDLRNPSAELEFVRGKLAEAPDNEAAWSYLYGFLRIFAPGEKAAALAIAKEFSPAPRALELAAELSTNPERAALFQDLCELEPLRKPFWQSRADAAQDAWTAL